MGVESRETEPDFHMFNSPMYIGELASKDYISYI